jgi:hypothetical protein
MSKHRLIAEALWAELVADSEGSAPALHRRLIEAPEFKPAPSSGVVSRESIGQAFLDWRTPGEWDQGGASWEDIRTGLDAIYALQLPAPVAELPIPTVEAVEEILFLAEGLDVVPRELRTKAAMTIQALLTKGRGGV